MPDCEHEVLSISFDAVELHVFRYASIRVRCDRCQMLFSWRGVKSGTPNPDEPVVSADGYELRAPITPGPGSVVGLLARAGMTDVLRNGA